MSDLDVLENLATYIASITAGSVGTNVFASQLPSAPRVATAVLYSGSSPTRPPMNRRIIEVVRRETIAQSATSYCNSVYESLRDAWCPASIPGRIRGVSAPLLVGYDSSNLMIFVMRFELISTTFK